ncbi:hypothetical protein GA0070216_106112 [Micromonospora matsumotoense]|uniref:Secreted protein n=1 Tax=Micromonospora matsumotoense TaxID=121616 RepID=A0A1C4YDK7_9ACTN|nr:hypothetical protein [Micromonospora matsumotoense]SCF18764.1 hypothetical protein GA0070216_106112 [Micromonospora matsumotoense]
MATFFRRKAAAVTLGVLALTLAGGGIAVAQPATKAPAEVAQPGAQQAGVAGQPSVTAAEAQQARAALKVSLAPPAAGSVAWAVVTSGGTLLQHSANVVSATKYGTGQYQVLLDYSVVGKAFQATIGTNDQFNVPPAGEISVAPRNQTPNGVFVQTYSSGGSVSSKPFHLFVAN